MAGVFNQVVKGRRLLRWLAIPLVLLFATVGLAIYAFAIRASAKSILKDVSALRVGATSVAEAEALAHTINVPFVSGIAITKSASSRLRFTTLGVWKLAIVDVDWSIV